MVAVKAMRDLMARSSVEGQLLTVTTSEAASNQYGPSTYRTTPPAHSSNAQHSPWHTRDSHNGTADRLPRVRVRWSSGWPRRLRYVSGSYVDVGRTTVQCQRQWPDGLASLPVISPPVMWSTAACMIGGGGLVVVVHPSTARAAAVDWLAAMPGPRHPAASVAGWL